MEPNEPKAGTGKPKHAWIEVYRSMPNKRPAGERIQDYQEIYGNYDEATAREQARRCLNCPEALCMEGCPLHNRIPEWMLLTAEGQFLEASALARSTSSMPEICARVCPQDRLCEGACILTGKAEPVAIGAIEKFLLEYAFARDAVEANPAPQNGFKVAVVGSGPGGIACADELARRGYAVTVFESLPTLGGLLMNGIPAFKLEKHVVDRRINVLRRRGVEFKVNVNVGVDLTLPQLQEEFDGVFLGFGAQKPKDLDVPGAHLEGVLPALPYLIQKNTNTPVDLPEVDVKGKRVIVLGAGDTAMDCLRTSIRCGATEARCLYRRDEDNMPGSRREYQNTTDEGAKFTFLVAPTEVVDDGQGNVKAIRCVRMELGAPDASGRRRPQEVKDSEHDYPADLILVAFGFDAVPFPEGSGFNELKVNRWGTLEVDENQMTNIPGVFSGGDQVRGPNLVVWAVRDGRKAAAGIHRYLSSRRLIEMALEQTDNVGMATV
ncbi:MAG: NAD(P)-dependent oxidoreductase [Verrucomicrobiales bacterium]|nr:NAD(P)-dependent oxidoreductase [Verrucomicrobiales bacterium]MCP5527199.1 NAD(P)-dependent oxidoreductase [Verrucomicrobiales bacterium]